MRDLTEVIIVQLFLLETILMRCKNDMKTSSRKNYERRDKHEWNDYRMRNDSKVNMEEV